jgi:hypothetical protein
MIKIKFKNGSTKEFEEFALQSANLRYANLEYADLQSANLRYADLQSANLQSANLRYADLQSANLRYANLQSANLRYANLECADLQGANLECANLQGADLDFSAWSLRCSSFDAKVDSDFAKQILYHVSRLDFEDMEGIKDAIRGFANSASVRTRHGLPEV